MNQNFFQSIQHESSWCEVSASAIRSNVEILRRRVGEKVILGVVVKSDAYGHGLIPCAQSFLESGVDWLIVNFAYEAVKLREAGINAPIYICGNTSAAQAETIARMQARIAIYDLEVAQAMAKAGREAGWVIPVHIKIETGTHRQGLVLQDALELARQIDQLDGIQLEGIATHYADIEDTTDHQFAMQQLTRLQEAEQAFRQAGFTLPIVQSANSAATILWNQTHAAMVRVGIAAYGLWPSKETYAKVLQTFAERGEGFIPNLQPVLSWRARVVQVKTVPTGGYVGYGRTFRAPYEMKIAVLPIGYHEGYDRRLSSLGHVLVNGMRAPVCGRICMNMMMVDVTHIPQVRAGTVATILGSDGDERVSAEQLANWMGTINYEVVARIHPSQPRYLINDLQSHEANGACETRQPAVSHIR
jgi:alanine racemase